MTKRRSFSDKFKATVALEALRGDKTAQEIAAKHKVHPTQVTTWKRQAIDGLTGVFSDKVRRIENNEVAFIDASVRFQLGDALERRLLVSDESRAQALAGSSGSALLWHTKAGRPAPDNGWALRADGAAGVPEGLVNENRFVNRDKALETLKALLATGAQSDVLIDMQDRRLRNTVLPDGACHPVFVFNREIGSAGRILWPLPGYHDLGTPGFLGPDDWTRVPWRSKQSRIAWRGIHGGRADKHGVVRREGIRLRPLLRKFDRGELSAEEVREALSWFPRHRVLQRYIEDSRFDLGFTGATQDINLEKYAFFSPYVRPRMSQQEALNFKYLLILRGADVGSSFYWTMNSGSLGLVMESYFESFGSGHFRPWEHYVPFKADLSDLEERISWCQDNDNACEEMTRKAQKVCALLARADLRREISKQLIARLEAKIDAG